MRQALIIRSIRFSANQMAKMIQSQEKTMRVTKAPKIFWTSSPVHLGHLSRKLAKGKNPTKTRKIDT